MPINIEYPVTISDISLYEELNDIQINVFSLEKTDYIDPQDTDDIRQYIKEEYKSNQHRKDVMNLLLISKDDNFHYVLINNLSRLFCSKTNHKTKFICPHCITKSFLKQELLDTHIIKCANYSELEVKPLDLITTCPEIGKDSIMQFKIKGELLNIRSI